MGNSWPAGETPRYHRWRRRNRPLVPPRRWRRLKPPTACHNFSAVLGENEVSDLFFCGHPLFYTPKKKKRTARQNKPLKISRANLPQKGKGGFHLPSFLSSFRGETCQVSGRVSSPGVFFKSTLSTQLRFFGDLIGKPFWLT